MILLMFDFLSSVAAWLRVVPVVLTSSIMIHESVGKFMFVFIEKQLSMFLSRSSLERFACFLVAVVLVSVCMNGRSQIAAMFWARSWD